MSSLSYYLPFLNLRSRSKRFFDGFLSMLEEISLSDNATTLSSATRCLAIGTNSGECEIELIKKFMPKLQTLTAIEPDAVSVAELKKNLQQHLPNVATEVHEEKFQQALDRGFGKDELPYDVILIFQCLFYFSAEDRRALFSALYDTLLTPDGVAIILHVSRPEVAGCIHDIGANLEASNKSALLADKEVQSEMESAGFKLFYENEYSFDADFRVVNEEVTVFFTKWLGCSITVQKLHEAVRKVCPDGVSQDSYKRMMWFQK